MQSCKRTRESLGKETRWLENRNKPIITAQDKCFTVESIKYNMVQ